MRGDNLAFTRAPAPVSDNNDAVGCPTTPRPGPIGHAGVLNLETPVRRAAARRSLATDQSVGTKLIGSTVAGRYALVRLLGDGGVGAVYKAEDNLLRRFVAIKLLHPSAAANPDTVQRFLLEAQAAASIGHPNIITLAGIECV